MFAEINGIRMAYTDEGEGSPILFIHGFPLNRRAWSGQVEAFMPRFRVIVPDLRGFGESGSSEGAVTMGRFADDIRALIQHLGLGQVILVGHSMGGYIALAFAKAHPAPLRGLVLVGTKAGMDSPEAAKSRRASAAKVQREGPLALVEAMAASMLSGPDAGGRRVAAVRACMVPASTEGITGALLGMAMRPDSWDVLDALRAPTLVVAGAEDAVIPPGESEALAKAIPNAHLRLIPKAGHLVAVDQSAAFNVVLREWLAGTCQDQRQEGT